MARSTRPEAGALFRADLIGIAIRLVDARREKPHGRVVGLRLFFPML